MIIEILRAVCSTGDGFLLSDELVRLVQSLYPGIDHDEARSRIVDLVERDLLSMGTVRHESTTFDGDVFTWSENFFYFTKENLGKIDGVWVVPK